MKLKQLQLLGILLILVGMLSYPSASHAQGGVSVTYTLNNNSNIQSVSHNGTADMGTATPTKLSVGVFSIKNTSGSRIHVENIQLANNPTFSATDPTDACSAPGCILEINQSMNFEVSTKSLATPRLDPYTAKVTIDTTAGFFVFNVRVRILEDNPAIHVQTSSGATISKNGSFDFGSTMLGSPVDRSFRILNNGNQTLSISSVTVSNSSFQIVSSPSSISPGGSGTLVVRLLANSAGSKNATVSIRSNDPNDNPFNFTVRGTVKEGTPDIRVVHAAGSSGTLPDGTRFQDDSFDIFNDGDGTLTNISVSTLTGTIIQQPASSVSPGGKTTFILRRLRSSQGCMSGTTLTIRSNDPDENPVTIGLLGNCVSPGGDPTPTPLPELTPPSPTF